MCEWKEIFNAYGADYETTMRRFMGKEAMYLRFLEMLFQDESIQIMGKEAMYLRFLEMLFQDESIQKLGDALENGDITGAFEAAHTLKGMAGNMGLTPLYEAVCTIVEPLRVGEQRGDYSELYRAVQAEFQRAGLFCGQLKKRLRGPTLRF